MSSSPNFPHTKVILLWKFPYFIFTEVEQGSVDTYLSIELTVANLHTTNAGEREPQVDEYKRRRKQATDFSKWRWNGERGSKRGKSLSRALAPQLFKVGWVGLGCWLLCGGSVEIDKCFALKMLDFVCCCSCGNIELLEQTKENIF